MIETKHYLGEQIYDKRIKIECLENRPAPYADMTRK
jgi:hypothetical protein